MCFKNSSITRHLIPEFEHYECSLLLLNMYEEINRANCSSSIGDGWLYGCQSIFPVVTHKQQRNFWTGEPVFPLTRKSERSVARQALDSRSNRAGTLGVTPGATSRDESAHWSPVISSESVRVKGEGGKGSSTNSDGMKKVEPSATSVLWWTDPRAVGSVAFVRFDVTHRLETGNFCRSIFPHVMLMLKCVYLNIGMASKTQHDLTSFFYFQKCKSLYYFTNTFDNDPNSKKLAKKQTFILATWQKEGQILRGKRGILAVSRASQSSTDKCILYIKQHILLLSTTGNSTAQAWVCLCASFPFWKAFHQHSLTGKVKEKRRSER